MAERIKTLTMEKQNNKILRNRIGSIFLILVILFLLWAFLIKGVHLFAILSGSMEPKIPTGSIVCAIPEDYEKIKVGDIITYKENNSIQVTHQVIQKNNDKKELTTKGLANNIADSPISSSKIIGIVKFYIPCPVLLQDYVQHLDIIKYVLLALSALLILILLRPTKHQNNFS